MANRLVMFDPFFQPANLQYFRSLVENGPIKIMLFGLVRSFFQPANRNLVSLPFLLSLSSQTSLHLPGREYKKNKNRNFDRFVPFF